MSYLFLPTLIFVILFPGYTPADKLADFTRFAAVQGEEVAVVDMFGAESLGKLVAASETSITLGFGNATRSFDREYVLKADRLRDGTVDGLVKGMVVGALMGWAASLQVAGSGPFFTSVAAYGGLGYVLDRAQTNRAPLYRK